MKQYSASWQIQICNPFEYQFSVEHYSSEWYIKWTKVPLWWNYMQERLLSFKALASHSWDEKVEIYYNCASRLYRPVYLTEVPDRGTWQRSMPMLEGPARGTCQRDLPEEPAIGTCQRWHMDLPDLFPRNLPKRSTAGNCQWTARELRRTLGNPPFMIHFTCVFPIFLTIS